MSFDTTRSPTLSKEKDEHEKIAVVVNEIKTLDVGLTLVANCAHDAPIDSNESKRVCRKVDLHILPLLFLIYTGKSS